MPGQIHEQQACGYKEFAGESRRRLMAQACKCRTDSSLRGDLSVTGNEVVARLHDAKRRYAKQRKNSNAAIVGNEEIVSKERWQEESSSTPSKATESGSDELSHGRRRSSMRRNSVMVNNDEIFSYS